jgi:putative CocE/NonD family hydrolase
MLKLACLSLAAAALLSPHIGMGSKVKADAFVSVSTHFIDVPAGSAAQSAGTIRLAATLYQPRLFPSAPAVVYIHGWGGRRLMGTDNLAYYIAAAGYTVLSYTARGFGDGESGGHVTLAGPDEINDLGRVIDWLMDDPDDTIGPRVTSIGVIGGSYGGGHSFQISSDPRVSAVIPLIGWTDLEQALYPNGVINYKQGLAQFYGGLDRAVGVAPFFNYDRLQFEMFDAAAEGRTPGPFVKQALRARSIAALDENGREVLDRAREPRVPTFIIQSWDDYLFPAPQVLEVFSQISAPKQIYLGRTGHPPGGHTSEADELYIGTQVLRWFNHHLRGIGGRDSKNVISSPAPFAGKLFASAEPLSASTQATTLYLKRGGELARRKKGKSREETAGATFRPGRIRPTNLGMEIPAESDMFSATVETASSLPRQLVYTFAPWQSDTEMLGSSEFTLYVSSRTSAQLDVIVRTFDVAPDGSETEVTAGVMRIADLAPGEVRRVTFRDFGDNWVFRAGHSIRLRLTNVDFPDFRPPGENDNLMSEITVHYGREFPSSIKVPVRVR